MLYRCVNSDGAEIVPTIHLEERPRVGDRIAWKVDVQVLDGPVRFERRERPNGLQWVCTLTATELTPAPKRK